MVLVPFFFLLALVHVVHFSFFLSSFFFFLFLLDASLYLAPYLVQHSLVSNGKMDGAAMMTCLLGF